MLIKCPQCGKGCESDEEPKIGQHLICPFCNGKFSYVEGMSELRASATVRTVCIGCGSVFEVDEKYLGTRQKCTDCGLEFEIWRYDAGTTSQQPLRHLVSSSQIPLPLPQQRDDVVIESACPSVERSIKSRSVSWGTRRNEICEEPRLLLKHAKKVLVAKPIVALGEVHSAGEKKCRIKNYFIRHGLIKEFNTKECAKLIFIAVLVLVGINNLVSDFIFSDNKEKKSGSESREEYPTPTEKNVAVFASLDDVIYDADSLSRGYIRISNNTCLRVAVVNEVFGKLMVLLPPYQRPDFDVCVYVSGEKDFRPYFSAGSIAPSGYYYISWVEQKCNPKGKDLKNIYIKTIPDEVKEKVLDIYISKRSERGLPLDL